jgi:rod shape-determining protein MreC
MNGMSKTRSFLIALLIIIGLIFLNFPSISKEVKNFFYSISTPVQKTFNRAIRQIKASWEFLNSLQEVSKKSVRLEEKIQELMAQNTKLKELEKENDFLRSYLKLPAISAYPIDLANVIGRDFQGTEKYILIDKGRLAGIEKNMPVVAFGNILVGKIVEVFDNFAKVLLVTSVNSKTPALIQESRAEGLIEGKQENTLSLDLIPKDIKVEKDQTVITSGAEGIFPKGLLIGKISLVESLEKEIFQKITVESVIKIGELERVFIIKKPTK